MYIMSPQWVDWTTLICIESDGHILCMYYIVQRVNEYTLVRRQKLAYAGVIRSSSLQHLDAVELSLENSS